MFCSGRDVMSQITQVYVSYEQFIKTRQRDRQNDRQTETYAARQRDRQTHRQTHRKTERLAGRWSDRETSQGDSYTLNADNEHIKMHTGIHESRVILPLITFSLQCLYGAQPSCIQKWRVLRCLLHWVYCNADLVFLCSHHGLSGRISCM